ncbi:3-keto-5-aminohexanoate cleavage protein [Sphingomonas sp.]|uniref:3-keto-5-aminohexanoate cleavage protein n=2 Tax=Sphingomonas sp. TaxID=28214 RepID=UPI001839C659|nr:3-keto-5-aminohexanoate cleavage protein [Sphingomonas sp.]MBA4763183.1 3-keto-5-aminohexanoate cleavage protein [Sphingomonas sp.]
MNPSEKPLVIEAAITPLRRGAPIKEVAENIHEGKECLAAGAGIVHHHHDFRKDREGAIQEMIDIEAAILEAYPHALLYGDYIRGTAIWEKNAHLQPMQDAGVLRMLALDPGLTLFGRMDENGLPSDSVTGGATFAEAHSVVEFARKHDKPVSVGVYEPGNLRWIRAYAQAGMFPKGSIIKLYFAGPYSMGFDKVRAVNFGLDPTPASLDVYLSMIEGVDMPFIVSCQGGVLLETPLARYALERGGHLRVGIEDTGGATEMTNRETVEAAIALAAEVGRPVASGAAAVAVLKGDTLVTA